jgi:hypothetical protein
MEFHFLTPFADFKKIYILPYNTYGMLTKFKTTFVLILFVIAACSFIGLSDISPTFSALGPIGPDGFNDTSKILLIEKRVRGISHEKMNKYLDKAFKDDYSGKYVLVAPEEIYTDPKYKDSITYRFVLRDHVETSQTQIEYNNKQRIEYQNHYEISYNIYDRVNKTTFITGVTSSIPAKAMKEAAKLLDRYLKSK